MFKLISGMILKDGKSIKDPKVREKFGVVGSVIGIICNVILFICKLVIGLLSGSIAITADAFNNLTDSGSNAVSIIGFKMSNRPADKEHPFGHGRYEYISALIVALLVLLVGFEVLCDSVPKILDPQPISMDLPMVAVLVLSMFAKLWMSFFYAKTGREIESSVMQAASVDSRNDVFMTGSVFISVIIGSVFKISLDGWVGLGLSLFIFISGINIVKETLNPILGEPPTAEFVNKLTAKVLSYEGILGVHDMIVHNYGADKWMATMHAEVSANSDFIRIHDIIDTIEREVRKEMGVELVIHMDPIVIDDQKVNLMRALTAGFASEVDPRISIHDFRMVEGPTHTNLIFDVTVPYDIKLSDEEIVDALSSKTDELDGNYFAVVTVDRSYISND